MKTAYPFAFGTVILTYEDDILTGLSFGGEDDQISDVDIKCRTVFTDEVMAQIEDYLQGKRKSFDFKYRLEGTAFQKQVWTILMDIPYGETRSYKEIAEALGKPNASRAVGMANNKNPLLLIVPCHRVIGANGRLVGYSGGLEMKKYLLDMERKGI